MALKGKQGAKRAKARAAKATAKRAAMGQPGFKSRYAKRKEARARGVPMAMREHPPWWGSLTFAAPPVKVLSPPPTVGKDL